MFSSASGTVGEVCRNSGGMPWAVGLSLEMMPERVNKPADAGAAESGSHLRVAKKKG